MRGLSVLAAALLLCLGLPAAATDNHDGHSPASSETATGLRDPDAYSDGMPAGTPAAGHHDTMTVAALMMNRLEYASPNHGPGATVLEAKAWWGTPYDRLWLKVDAETVNNCLDHARTEVLWGHAIAPFWDLQAGLRHDGGTGPARQWLAVGVQGLAPWWFEVDATAYLGSDGRSALRLEAEYELLLNQRWVLQPRIEINAYGRADPARLLGSGLADLTTGLRLRYHFNRQFAPYLGIEWRDRHGGTADLLRAAGEPAGERRIVAGVRFWF
ncbi:MAG: copper resistance protein B [Proteobacteria bacterium]|nr:copper resistance protein B [Pseudomonadota bacterium]HQR04226.1 copper resistance protein B [Rhodocyclaceae bacterium]